MTALPAFSANKAPNTIFDLGALMDMYRTNIAQDLALAEQLGVDLTEAKIVQHFDEPAQTFYPNVFGGDKSWEELRDEFLALNPAFPRPLYPEALPLLDALNEQGAAIGLVTVCTRATAERHIEDHNGPLSFGEFLGRFVTPRLFAEDVIDAEIEPKPFSQLLARALGSTSLD